MLKGEAIHARAALRGTYNGRMWILAAATSDTGFDSVPSAVPGTIVRDSGLPCRMVRMTPQETETLARQAGRQYYRLFYGGAVAAMDTGDRVAIDAADADFAMDDGAAICEVVGTYALTSGTVVQRMAIIAQVLPPEYVPYTAVAP